MEFLALDLPVSISPPPLVAGLVILLLLVAGGLYLGARADRMRIQAERREPVRKAA